MPSKHAGKPTGHRAEGAGAKLAGTAEESAGRPAKDFDKDIAPSDPWADKPYSPTDPDIIAIVAKWPTPGRHSELSQMLARVLNLTSKPTNYSTHLARQAAENDTDEANEKTDNNRTG